MLISDVIVKQEALEQEYRRMALYSRQPLEKAYAIRQADEAQQIAGWLREYMALREQIRKESEK